LRSLSGLLAAVVLALLLTRVARGHARLLQSRPRLGVELDQGAGDPETEGTGLPAVATSVQRRVDVVHVVRVGRTQRLRDHHAMGLRREVVLEGAPVDGDAPGTG